jgi:anti-sigma B factor antagonist
MNTIPTPFAIRVASIADQAVRVEVEGELDLTTASSFREAIRQQISQGRSVVLDFSKTEFMDSSGLNALIQAIHDSGNDGTELAVTSDLPDQVRRLFQMTGIDTILPIVSR